MMKFNDLFVSKEGRFSVGIEESSQKPYVSIPVSNGLVDYEEYYAIDIEALELYQTDMKAAQEFVQRCRDRKNDHLLIVKPGKSRGVPV